VSWHTDLHEYFAGQRGMQIGDPLGAHFRSVIPGGKSTVTAATRSVISPDQSGFLAAEAS